MKVYISNYRNHWISPYTILERVFFWTDWSKCNRKTVLVKEEDWIDYPEWVDNLADKLMWVSQSIQWFLDKVRPYKVKVRIDRYDTWSMDHTLSHIILPMLKQLKETKHGSPLVDDDDVPVELRSDVPGARSGLDDWETDHNWHKRWDYVLNEMIFAFEHIVDDSWEEKFHTGEYDKTKIPGEEGWLGTSQYDVEGAAKVHNRINNGLKLFGKYYRGLWD